MGWSDVESSDHSDVATHGSRRGRSRSGGRSSGRSRSRSRALERPTARVPVLRRGLLRRISGVNDPDPPMPVFCGSSSIRWWQSPLWTSLLHYRREMPRRFERPVRVLSACSGLLGESFVLQACGVPAVFEASDQKRCAATFALRHFGDNISHYFADLDSSIAKRGHCYKHLRECDLTSLQTAPDILTAGAPCQPFTQYRVRKTKKAGSKTSVDASGHPSYGVTFELMQQLIEARRPTCALFEQVIGFGNPEGSGKSPLQQFVEMLSQYFEGVKVVQLNSDDWLEVSRVRYYIGAFSGAVGGQAAASAWVEKVQEAVNLRRAAPPTKVIGELVSASEVVEAARRESEASLATEETARMSDTEYKSWEVKSVQMRDKLQVTHDYSPWTSAHPCHGLPLTPRIRDLVDVAWIDHRQRSGSSEDSKDGFFVDISQGVHRRPWGRLRCLTSTSRVFSFEAGATLPVKTHFLMQGYPQSIDLAGISETQQRSLAGEGFFLPCYGVAMYAMILTVGAPWWGPPPPSSTT